MPEQRSIISRSPRTTIGRPATLREDTGAPLEIAIEDLSETGCLIFAPVALPVGTTVTVGIAGLGRREAVVRRIEGRLVGCAFARPIAAADIARARSQEVVVTLAPAALPAAGPSLLDTPASTEPALLDEVRDVATVMDGQLFAYCPPARFHLGTAMIAATALAVAIGGVLLR